MRRELVATIGSTERSVIVEKGDDGRWRVIVDGREQVVDAVEVRPGTWSLLIDGRSHLVELDERKRSTAALSAGTETSVVVEDARRKRLAAAAQREGSSGTGEVLSAPIAGKVVKILVAVGDTVEAGTPVAVLEAMKMENEIVAEKGGTVAQIHAEAGQSVDTGDLLVTLK